MIPAETPTPPRPALPPVSETTASRRWASRTPKARPRSKSAAGRVPSSRPAELAVSGDLDLFSDLEYPKAYVSADVMVVRPVLGYRCRINLNTAGIDGPMPAVAIEVPSERSAQREDLSLESDTSLASGADEYVLVDPTGEFLGGRMQLRRSRPDGRRAVFRDADGGVASRLGFRLRGGADGSSRCPAPRPAAIRRAEDEARLRQAAEERIRELARLRSLQPPTP